MKKKKLFEWKEYLQKSQDYLQEQKSKIVDTFGDRIKYEIDYNTRKYVAKDPETKQEIFKGKFVGIGIYNKEKQTFLYDWANKNITMDTRKSSLVVRRIYEEYNYDAFGSEKLEETNLTTCLYVSACIVMYIQAKNLVTINSGNTVHVLAITSIRKVRGYKSKIKQIKELRK